MSITNTQFAAALRALADTYEAHPEMAAPEHLDLWLQNASREKFAASVKAFGTCKKCPPAYKDDVFFTVEKPISGVPVRMQTFRSNICRKVRVMKEVDDWDCSDPLLESLVSSATEAAVTA
jgi:hypothetical protein